MNCQDLAECHGKGNQRWWKSSRRKVKTSDCIQSTAGHVKPGGNTGGPSSKPKYYSVTDREEVLWRKGEKHPGRGVKENLKPCVYKHRKFINERSGTFCRMVRRVNVTGKVKHLRCEAVARASLKRAHEVSCIRPETGWPIHVQDEVKVKLDGGPNPRSLKCPGMRCG